ncbi:GNAT family N-acetyltransferase [Fonticella tunisiensis]|uniref:Acetyltransferase (GNAT) family protein n=1 Tax=Fonticella tunisiensis TaxID=1096341 RepID=A0A4R7K632_9CLOT|nr:GNAT family N-acetyltransferase [Fonticella tunisiensis]TDT45982.1 acetyltransferase (GNAT) family protein [Fonticella tunisiensis]
MEPIAVQQEGIIFLKKHFNTSEKFGEIEKKVLEVRRAKLEDISEIQRITKEAFKQYREYAGGDSKIAAMEETYEDIKRDIETKEVFVALLNGIPVGSVRIEVFPDKTAYLSRFGVRPDYQNNGVGKALLDVVDTAMKEMGIKKIYLHTASKATPLICCYYKRGFYIDSTTKDRGYIRALLCKEYKEDE